MDQKGQGTEESIRRRIFLSICLLKSSSSEQDIFVFQSLLMFPSTKVRAFFHITLYLQNVCEGKIYPGKLDSGEKKRYFVARTEYNSLMAGTVNRHLSTVRNVLGVVNEN